MMASRRLPISRILTTLATVTGRTTFPDISSRAWEHPADRVALTALRRLKGFDQVLKVLAAMLRERQHRPEVTRAAR